MKHEIKKRNINCSLLLVVVLVIGQFFVLSAVAQSVSKADLTLLKTYWKAVELNGSVVSLGTGKKELRLILNDTPKQAKGFSGCNSFSSRFEQNNQNITFGRLAATMMACIDGMDQEQQFLQALGKVKRFSISGEELVLYDAQDHILLRFNGSLFAIKNTAATAM